MRNAKSALVLPVMFSLCAAQAHAAGLVIVPTFDSTITSLSNAAAIEGTINSAISVYEADFSNPITVSIDFSNMNSGLGASSFNFATSTYSNYRTALINDKNAGTDNTDFLAYLPASGNPVPGQSASNVETTTAGGRALGFNTPGVTNVNGVNYDGHISLYTAITNVSRTGPQDPNKYDLQSVTEHEIDEILGFNSDLDNGFPAGYVGPTDFFRYNGINSRSFTKSTSEKSYFSIDGGNKVLEYFNQQNSGDRHDWASSGESYDLGPAVQNAFATPGTAPDLGPGEFAALDVAGYNRTNASPAPEPAQVATLSMIGLGLGGLLLRARKRKSGEPMA